MAQRIARITTAPEVTLDLGNYTLTSRDVYKLGNKLLIFSKAASAAVNRSNIGDYIDQEIEVLFTKSAQSRKVRITDARFTAEAPFSPFVFEVEPVDPNQSWPA